MKKVFFILLVLFISVSASAQNKKAEKTAKNTTEKMTAELSLNQEESAKVYDVFVAKFTKAIEIKTKYAEDPATKKKEMSTLSKETQGKLKAIVGKEKMTQWNSYLKANKKK